MYIPVFASEQMPSYEIRAFVRQYFDENGNKLHCRKSLFLPAAVGVGGDFDR
jgi:hypothetical protein